MKHIYTFIFSALLLSGCSVPTFESVKEISSSSENLYSDKEILTDTLKVIEFSEFILFDLYGKNEIRKQQPYNISLKDGIWTITGSLPPLAKGGVFEINIKSKDCQITKISHGK